MRLTDEEREKILNLVAREVVDRQNWDAKWHTEETKEQLNWWTNLYHLLSDNSMWSVKGSPDGRK